MSKESKPLENLIDDINGAMEKFYKSVGKTIPQDELLSYLTLFAYYYASGLVIVRDDLEITDEQILKKATRVLQNQMDDITKDIKQDQAEPLH